MPYIEKAEKSYNALDAAAQSAVNDFLCENNPADFDLFLERCREKFKEKMQEAVAKYSEAAEKLKEYIK